MRRLASVLVCLVGLASSALAEARIALVIGNGNYSAVTSLENAINDAELMAQSLGGLGFDVRLVQDATQGELQRAVAEFGRDLRAGGPEAVGLFYYAGHGVQSFGANYLLPVDADLTVAADLDLVGLEAASVLRQMASARNRTNIVILDACRNNPFVDIPDMDDNGLAEMNAPTGTFLAYATAPGAVALDGLGANSPFTAALAETIQTENQPIEQLFKQVRVKVIAETAGAQTPWDTSSLTQEFMFREGEKLTPEQVAEEQLWLSVSATRDPVQIMLFLRNYPDGRYGGEARDLLGEVLQTELGGSRKKEPEQTAAAPIPEPAPDPEPEPAPQVQAPATSETDLMEAARSSGRIEDYQAYLDAYPEGVFAELVKIEIASLRAKASTDPIGPPEAKPAAAPQTTEEDVTEDFVVFFDQPLQHGVPEIVGRTIMQVTEQSPLFPPIEGLPEAMWKSQTCSNCHQWTRDALCAQGSTYLKESGTRALKKEHPFGGSFKRNLRSWARADCQ